MLAGVFLGNGKFELREVPKPVIEKEKNLMLFQLLLVLL